MLFLYYTLLSRIIFQNKIENDQFLQTSGCELEPIRIESGNGKLWDKDESDADVSKRDVVCGLIRMSTVDRIRYKWVLSLFITLYTCLNKKITSARLVLIINNIVKIFSFLLENGNLDLVSKIECLQIISRFCEHSLQAATFVFEHPYLFKVLLQLLQIEKGCLF